KEVFAKAIHNWSPRAKNPFVAINCSAIPENLLESELFGHAKGSFTGAIEKKIGLFEEADGGTLFLDEIGDLSLQLQAKLLRVLQEKEIKRVGENQPRSIDVRVIVATHKDLRAEVQAKRFREDLFFRLNVIPLKIPALRDRREDILPLAEFFLRKFNGLNGTTITGFKKSAKEFLLTNNWRGNVRELENTIERAVVLSTGNEIDITSFLTFEENTLPEKTSRVEDRTNAFVFRYGDVAAPLQELEKKYIQFVYEKCDRVKDLTAKTLGIDRKTLYRKLQDEL
ncbi:MAG: sigma-54-dependent Fis family transcriptional regulator, partial [Bdellovibrio sp.]|nr:sigma-54-dependent Fis family transcriptional regulator [Bdellovibrio sp.]